MVLCVLCFLGFLFCFFIENKLFIGLFVISTTSMVGRTLFVLLLSAQSEKSSCHESITKTQDHKSFCRLPSDDAKLHRPLTPPCSLQSLFCIALFESSSTYVHLPLLLYVTPCCSLKYVFAKAILILFTNFTTFFPSIFLSLTPHLPNSFSSPLFPSPTSTPKTTPITPLSPLETLSTSLSNYSD